MSDKIKWICIYKSNNKFDAEVVKEDEAKGMVTVKTSKGEV